MKKSNLLLLAALMLVLVSLTAYNIELKSSYNRVNHKDPNFGTIALNLKDFDEIEVSDVNITVKQGPFAIRVNDYILQCVKIRKEGRRLKITLIPPPEIYFSKIDPLINISCPQLKVLQANTDYTTDGRLISDVKNSPPPYKYGAYTTNVYIKGFMLDSLQVEGLNSSAIFLENNIIQNLRANIGVASDQSSALSILPGNNIKSANLHICNSSSLILNNVEIPDLKYKLSDSAQITLSGASLAALKKQ